VPPGWQNRFAQVLAETLAGARPPRQIVPWTTEETLRRIERLGPRLASEQRPRVRRVLTSLPAPDVMEMAVVVGFGPRVKALAVRLEKEGSSIIKSGIKGIFCGGTEMTAQWIRFAIEEYLEGGKDVYIAPTYGNTLMGLAASEMPTARDNYKIAYYAPQPRAVAQVVDFKDYDKEVGVGQTGRVLLTTLTKEFFVPRFLERDEGVREPPSEKYPWPGVSGVKPFREIAAATTVGVY